MSRFLRRSFFSEPSVSSGRGRRESGRGWSGLGMAGVRLLPEEGAVQLSSQATAPL